MYPARPTRRGAAISTPGARRRNRDASKKSPNSGWFRQIPGARAIMFESARPAKATAGRGGRVCRQAPAVRPTMNAMVLDRPLPNRRRSDASVSGDRYPRPARQGCGQNSRTRPQDAARVPMTTGEGTIRPERMLFHAARLCRPSWCPTGLRTGSHTPGGNPCARNWRTRRVSLPCFLARSAALEIDKFPD